jgi:SPP1 family predicted phage head-tail adaptor
MQFITRIRQSSQGTDQYGEPIYTTTETVLEAAVAARTGSKTVGAAEITVTSGLTVYLPYDTDVQNDDVFIYKNERYVLDGEKFDWENPYGNWKPGTVIDLQRETNG